MEKDQNESPQTTTAELRHKAEENLFAEAEELHPLRPMRETEERKRVEAALRGREIPYRSLSGPLKNIRIGG